MTLYLRVRTAGPACGQTIPIVTSQFTIGRAAECNLRPASAMVSKHHCALYLEDHQVYVQDFGSTNGTFVDDRPVRGVTRLDHGQILKVGPLSFDILMEHPSAVTGEEPTSVLSQHGEATAGEARADSSQANDDTLHAPEKNSANKPSKEQPTAGAGEANLARYRKGKRSAE